VGYVRLNGFTGPPAYEQVAAQVNRFIDLDLDALVLDMRGNPADEWTSAAALRPSSC